MTRAFVALRPPEGVLDVVAECVATARTTVPQARWAPREQWHVTLQFLGNDADVDAVIGALDELPVVGATVQLGGGGAFPSARRANVCWLGLAVGDDWCISLARTVSEQLLPLGYEPERRPFYAHLTVGRARGRTSVDAREFVARVPPVIGDPWPAAEIVVYESRLGRDGATYVARGAIPLR